MRNRERDGFGRGGTYHVVNADQRFVKGGGEGLGCIGANAETSTDTRTSGERYSVYVTHRQPRLVQRSANGGGLRTT